MSLCDYLLPGCLLQAVDQSRCFNFCFWAKCMLFLCIPLEFLSFTPSLPTVWGYPKAHPALAIHSISQFGPFGLASDMGGRVLPLHLHLECFCECRLSDSIGVEREWCWCSSTDLVVSFAVGWSQCQLTCLTMFSRRWPDHLRHMDCELLRDGGGSRWCSSLNSGLNLPTSFTGTRMACFFSRERRGRNGSKDLKKWCWLACSSLLRHPLPFPVLDVTQPLGCGLVGFCVHNGIYLCGGECNEHPFPVKESQNVRTLKNF